jgi:phage-related protein
MAEDIMIKVELEAQKAVQNLQNLSDHIKTTQSTVNNKLSTSISNVGTKLQGAGQKISTFGNTIKEKLKGETAAAFKYAGDAALDFARKCIDSAIRSESSWTRFGALVNSNGGNWEAEESKIRSWAKTFSNNMGYAVSDTREASMTLMQMGVKSSELQSAMKGVAGVAARTGMTESEAASMVASALNGRAGQLAKLTGLRVEDYKNADGQIDRERLLNDLYNQNTDAIEAHSNTTEAQIQRMNNSWGSFKTSIGNALMPVVKIIADVVSAIADGFSKLPNEAKTLIAVFLVIGGAVGAFIGVLGMIAPALVSIGGIITAIGTAGSIAAFLAPTITGLSAGFHVLAGAIAPLILPILAVVAALTALYFIGIKMGWWKDLNGMIARFREVIGQAIGAVQNFVSWFARLFTDFPAAKAEFDNFIASLREKFMEGLSKLGDIARDILGNLGNIVRDAISGLGANVVEGGGFTEGLLAIFLPLPMLIYGALSRIAPYVYQALVNTWNVAVQWVTNIRNAIVQRFNLMVANVRQVFTNIVNTIRARLTTARNTAANLATAIRTAIVTRIQAIVARVRAFFTNIVSTIRSRLSSAAATARSQAVAIYNNIMTKIRELPGQIAAEVGKLGGIIRDKLVEAGKAAFSGAGSLVSQFLNGLDRHSPGRIQRETLAEFSSLPGIVLTQGALAARSAGNAARGIVGAWTDNMETLTVPLDGLQEQFNTWNPVNVIGSIRGFSDVNVLGSPIANVERTPNSYMNSSTSTVNNQKHTEYHEHIDHLHIDLNNLAEDEKTRWYNMLDEISRGAPI